MAQKGIREFDAKKLMIKYLQDYMPKIENRSAYFPIKTALVTPDFSLEDVAKNEPWLKSEKLVVKPDMLIGKRGKNKLILLGATFDEAEKWIREHQEATISGVTGKFTHFIIEPFLPHNTEYYLAIKDHKDGDYIYFSKSGGIDIEENWDKVLELNIPIDKDLDDPEILKNLKEMLKKQLSGMELDIINDFIIGFYGFYRNLHFTYLELNPFIIDTIDNLDTSIGTDSRTNIIPLDCVARLDDTAHHWMKDIWGEIDFPAPFGLEKTNEEQYISDLDEKSGASLKLMVLNPEGRIWTMIAGGGASVIYTDSVVDAGYGNELANYGEYSGNPSLDETCEYARTILDLMTRKKAPDGKILIIGGGIANFTDVAKTFKGIIKAIREYKDKIIDHKIMIYVRRGGPNYEVGLKNMRKLGRDLDIPIEVHGPEMHLTRIVTIAIKNMFKEVKSR